jgi:group I intron endonuclease
VIPFGVPVVYEIAKVGNQKRYVGSTFRYRRRYDEHRVRLESGNHHCQHLQNAFWKHGAGGFVMRPLEIVASSSLLISREQSWMDSFPSRQLYNSSLIAGVPRSQTKSVAGIHTKTGAKIVFNSATLAAIACHGSAELAGMVRKAARKNSRSAGFYWSWNTEDTLQTILQKKRSKLESSQDERPHRVFAFTLDGQLAKSFYRISDAAREIGEHHSAISNAIRHSRFRTCGGFTWSKTTTPKAAKTLKEKPVVQMSGEVVLGRWASCKLAAAELGHEGVSHKGISDAANGWAKSHRGYQWGFDKT